jgi:hypothetical protein
MEFLASIFGAGAMGAGGVVTGFFGGIIGQISKHFQEKSRQSHEAQKWKHEESKRNHDSRMASMEIMAESDIAKDKALSASIESDSRLSNSNSSPWANNVKVVYRPFLTTLLLIIASIMFVMFMSALEVQAHALNQVFSGNEMKEIIKYMIYTVFYTASTAAMWWFCDRALSPSFAK